MSNITSTEVLQTFEGAKNINAAFKKFLKNDVANDPKNLKFIKSLKQVFVSKDAAVKESFLATHLPEYEPHMFVVGRYAYVDAVDSVTEEVITRFAEEFNTTYVKNEQAVEFKNEERFKQIVLEVMGIINQRFEEQTLPHSNFMKTIVLTSIFDADVLKLVVPIVEGL